MKKKLAFVLALAMLSAFMLAACGGSKIDELKGLYEDAGYTVNVVKNGDNEILTAIKGTSTATITYATGSDAKQAIEALEALAKLAPNQNVSTKEGKYICVATDAAALKIFNDAF